MKARKFLLMSASHPAMMMVWMQRYAAMIIADEIRNRGKAHA
jgi:hypothetical protein